MAQTGPPTSRDQAPDPLSGVGSEDDAHSAVDRSAGTRTVYATDNSIYQLAPDGVFVPGSASEVAEIVAVNADSTSPRSITARGAGTGTNGQSLTAGLIIDTKRRLNRIGDLDTAKRTITVEPGVVAAQLDEHLHPHGLFWPPETSTVTRCTVGGMIATDAAGQGSLRYGRTSRHVVALDVVLDDGSRWHARARAVAEAEKLAAGNGREAEIWRALLAVPIRDYGLPELARGFSGYGIDRVRRLDPVMGEVIDPIPVLCGSEGTLAITVGATLALSPIPEHRVLVVAAYPTFDDALADSLRLRDTNPTAIETIDETTLRQGTASTAWAIVGHLIAPDPDNIGSVLLIEYASEEAAGDSLEVPPNPGTVADRIRAGGRTTEVAVITDPAIRAAAWRVRADAVGILAKVPPGTPQPTAFVEDCAVPVAEMPAFIDGFRRILDGHGLRYGMFGHADVGCVHVRPALDLIDRSHEELVTTITNQVVELLEHHGGILWGEHGRGVRSQFADRFLPPDTVTVMRHVKAAFDPQDRFNPGKLYRPFGHARPVLAIDSVPTRASLNRTVPVEIRRDYQSAFSCNGNGLCHHYSAAEVMCPSYKATGDPRLSPKGRADLLRAWLASEADDPGSAAHDELTDDVADSLASCLSCSACTGRCPVQVDIPELKSRFLERYHRTRRRPLSHIFLSRFETLASGLDIASTLAPAPTRWLTKGAGRALGLVDLPSPEKAPFAPLDTTASGMPDFRRDQPTDLVLLPEVFTSVFDRSTRFAAAQALQAVGYTVSLARFVNSGKFDHVKGNRRRFGKAAEAQAELVRSVMGSGARPVVIDPAVTLLHRHEYPAILPDFPALTGGIPTVANLAEVLAERLDRLPPAAEARRVQIFGHCTERSLAPTWVQHWRQILEAVGHSVEVVETTCCGMAGIFGHEIDNQQISRALFERGWRDRLADEVTSVATGWSCRSQAERFGFENLRHPVQLLSPVDSSQGS